MLRILRMAIALAITLGAITWAVCRLFAYGSTFVTIGGMTVLLIVAAVIVPSDLLEGV